jgi:hypothetical protein
MADLLQKRLDYLIHDLKAYNDFPHPSRGLRNAVKSHLYKWSKDQEDMQTIQIPILQEDLWREACMRKKQDFLDQDWHQLQLYLASSKHLQIIDKKGYILVYRIPLPEKHLQQLASTEHLVPPRTVKQHSCGITSNRHWGLWKKYVVEPKMTGDYLRDLPHSQQWLEENQGLFQHLSNILCLLDPKMYVRFSSIKGFLPESVVPACGAWYACALNLGMTADGTQH